MKLTDVLSREEWAEFERDLHDRFNLNCAVFNASGTGVTGKPNWCNQLCPRIKANKDALAAICAPGNQNFMAQAEKTREAVIGECDAGFVKIGVPIFDDNVFMGIAGGCGLLPEGGELEAFLIEKTSGMSGETIAELSAGIASISPGEAKEIALFIDQKVHGFITEAGKGNNNPARFR